MPNDTWITGDLNSIFTGTAEKLRVTQDALNKTKLESQKVLDSFNEKANAAIAGLEVANDLLNQIQAAGFNILFMEPASKTFSQRLAEADNKPAEDEFTSGLIIFAQAPSIELTIKRYTALLKILKS